jgi:hypothetical protein
MSNVYGKGCKEKGGDRVRRGIYELDNCGLTSEKVRELWLLTSRLALMGQNQHVIGSLIVMFIESMIAGVHGGYLLFTTAHFWFLTVCKFDFS